MNTETTVKPVYSGHATRTRIYRTLFLEQSRKLRANSYIATERIVSMKINQRECRPIADYDIILGNCENTEGVNKLDIYKLQRIDK